MRHPENKVNRRWDMKDAEFWGDENTGFNYVSATSRSVAWRFWLRLWISRFSN